MKFVYLITVFLISYSAFSQTKTSTFNSFRGNAVYSSDRKVIAVSEDKDLTLRDPQTLLVTRRLNAGAFKKMYHNKTITSIVFCDDHKHLITGGLDTKLIYWDYTTGVSTKMWSAPHPIKSVKYIEGETVTLITDFDFIIYDFATEKIVSSTHKDFRNQALAVASENKLIVLASSASSIVPTNDSDATGKVNLTLYDGSGKVIKSHQLLSDDLTALEINSAGTLMAAGTKKGIINIFNNEDKLVSTLKTGRKWIRCLKFSQDERLLAGGDDWGNCVIYSVDKETIIENINIKKLPILSLDFNPDATELLIATQGKLSSWDLKKFSPAVFQLKNQKDLSPPQIYISSPPNVQNDKIRFFNDLIAIKGTVMDESGIRNLKINGITVPLKENNNFVINIPLGMGDNPISIEAQDINDNIAVKKFVVQRKNKEGEEYDASKSRNFLFVIGINDYQYWPKLNNAVRDANDITNTLIKLYNFDFDNITILKNEQATRSNIYKSLRALISQVSSQDNLMIYFSGHGYFDDLVNEGYWVPVEGQINATGDYLSNSDLLKLVGNINSQHTFLVADACFSGSLFGDIKRGYSENVERYKSRWGLVSGRLEVVSDGAMGENSPFAKAVLDFLNENTKDKFAISELVQYVKIKVAERSNQTPLGNPLKMNGDEGGELVLYKKKQ